LNAEPNYSQVQSEIRPHAIDSGHEGVGTK
jgi:hypothetical protein